MKLYLKRDTTGECSAFAVFDEKGEQKYAVCAEAGAGIRMTVFTGNGDIASLIKYNSFVLNYFTVSCARRFYVLIPCTGTQFAFAVYGSTYRFAGSLADGSFTMTTSSGDIVMTQKKCTVEHGEGYELDISDEAHELFLLSCALCADMYISCAPGEAAVPTV